MFRTFISFVVLQALAVTALAEAGLWQSNSDLARVRLISATDGVPQSGQLNLGLEFEISPGWVTYWKIQGPVGVPLTADWGQSVNIASANIQYPLPERYTYTVPGLDDESMESFVYREHLVLPIEIEVVDPNQPVTAMANLQFTVCGELCIFTDAQVRIDLFPGSEGRSAEAEIIKAFRDQVPPLPLAESPGLALIGHTFHEEKGVLEYQLESIQPLQSPDVFIGSNFGGFVFGRPEISLSKDATQALVQVPMTSGGFGGETPANTDIYVTIADAGRGVDLGFIRTGDPESFMPRLQDGTFEVQSASTGFWNQLETLLGL